MRSSRCGNQSDAVHIAGCVQRMFSQSLLSMGSERKTFRPPACLNERRGHEVAELRFIGPPGDFNVTKTVIGKMRLEGFNPAAAQRIAVRLLAIRRLSVYTMPSSLSISAWRSFTVLPARLAR